MTTRFGDVKALDLLHIHNSLTRHALHQHTGREVKHLGDGIMASFVSIDQSLECAVAIQRAFAAYNVQNSGAPLHLRIGLSVGEPVESDNDLFGRTVQLASRLCAHVPSSAGAVLRREERQDRTSQQARRAAAPCQNVRMERARASQCAKRRGEAGLPRNLTLCL
jgi:class 3 adenylate cyclase